MPENPLARITYFEWIIAQWEAGLSPLEATIEHIRALHMDHLLEKGCCTDGSFDPDSE